MNWSKDSTLLNSSSSDGISLDLYKGENDVIILRIDDGGNLLWTKHYGGRGNDEAIAIASLSDGSFVVAGRTRSNQGDEANDGDFADMGKGDDDIFIMKLNGDGNLYPLKK